MTADELIDGYVADVIMLLPGGSARTWRRSCGHC